MKVTLTYDIFWTPVEWAKENCPSYITNALHLDEDDRPDIAKVDYFFGSEADAVLFALKWL